MAQTLVPQQQQPLPPLNRSAPRLPVAAAAAAPLTMTMTSVQAPPSQAAPIEDTLFEWIDKQSLSGVRSPALRWQYSQVLAPSRACAFGQRTTLRWQPAVTAAHAPLSLRHLLLRITMPPLSTTSTRRHQQQQQQRGTTAPITKFWHPQVVWRLFERVEFYVGDNSEPVATVYPDANAMLLCAAKDPLLHKHYATLVTQHSQLDDEHVQRDLVDESWTFELPLVLPSADGDRQWFVRGLGDQDIRMVVTLRDVIDCVLLEDDRVYNSTRDPATIAKRFRLPLDVEMTWLASTGHASQRYAADLGFRPTRTQYGMPWPALHRVGQLHADTWQHTFSDMSYWQVALHNTALTSALVFILHYDSFRNCNKDVPFESIEVLLGVERLTKIAYEDATFLANVMLGDDGCGGNRLDTTSQVVMVPFSDDPLAQRHTLEQVAFVDLGKAPITVRFIQPSRLATQTMEHLKVYALQLNTLNWSKTTNRLNTFTTPSPPPPQQS